MLFSSVSQNDRGVVNLSGIEVALRNALEQNRLVPHGEYPSALGDNIYQPSLVISNLSELEGEVKKGAKRIRVDIEHLFGMNTNLMKRLCMKHTWKLYQMKSQVQAHLFSIFFMVNIYTTLNWNKSSIKFDVNPPSIEEYIGGNQEFIDLENNYEDDYITELLLNGMN